MSGYTVFMVALNISLMYKYSQVYLYITKLSIMYNFCSKYVNSLPVYYLLFTLFKVKIVIDTVKKNFAFNQNF